MMSPEKVAEMYGGDKRRIGQAAQMGLEDPTVAVMAGMFIDRMRNAAAKEGIPQASVAEEVMEPAAGLAALPVPEEAMPEEYAGGGVVAFAGGGDTNPYSRYTGMADPKSNLLQFTDEEIEEQKKLKDAGLLDALSYMKRKFADPVVEYFASDPLRRGITGQPAATTKQTEVDTGPAYPDETTRGTAARVARGGPGRTMEEMGIGATEMAARRAAEEAAAKRGPATTGAAPKEETTEDFFTRRKRMLREAGVSDDPFAKDREALAQLKGKSGSEREKLNALTMIKAGLGIAGGKSQYALQNLAGATPAIESYEKGLRQLKEDEKEYAKIDRDLRKAEDALKRGDVDKALEYEDKAMQRKIQLRGVEAQERSAARPSTPEEYLRLQRLADSGDKSAQRALQGMFGSAKLGQVDERFLRSEWGKMKPLDKMLLARDKNITTFEQWAASQGYPVGGGAGVGGAGWGIRALPSGQ